MKHQKYMHLCKGVAVVLLSLGMTAVASAAERFSTGDRVSISVFGQPDLATDARVSEGGVVSMPLIQQVQVAGKTALEVERAVASALSRQDFVRNPKVTVQLLEPGASDAETVTILGHVARPGRFQVSTTEGGAKTLVSLLALAGGLADDAGERLMLTRIENGGEQTLFVDLTNLIQRGNLAQNYSLRGGDVVFVPKMKEFYIYGEVRNPGRYRLESNMSVIQALAVGGGLTASGTEKGMTLRRTGGDGKSETRKAKLDLDLQPNDVLYIREALF